MAKVETVHWSELFGNKTNKGLHPAMASERGYVRQTRTKLIDSPVAGVYNVVYDKDYLSEYMFIKICKPLFVLGKERTLELLEEAWDSYYGENPTILPSKRVRIQS